MLFFNFMSLSAEKVEHLVPFLKFLVHLVLAAFKCLFNKFVLTGKLQPNKSVTEFKKFIPEPFLIKIAYLEHYRDVAHAFLIEIYFVGSLEHRDSLYRKGGFKDKSYYEFLPGSISGIVPVGGILRLGQATVILSYARRLVIAVKRKRTFYDIFEEVLGREVSICTSSRKRPQAF